MSANARSMRIRVSGSGAVNGKRNAVPPSPSEAKPAFNGIGFALMHRARLGEAPFARRRDERLHVPRNEVRRDRHEAIPPDSDRRQRQVVVPRQE